MTRLRAPVIAGILAAAFASSPHAATQLPEFGDLPISAQLGPAASPALRTEQLHHTVEDLVELTLSTRTAGDVLWGRIPGSASDHAAADYVKRRFSAAGLSDVHSDTVALQPQWKPADVTLEVISNGKQLPPFQSLFLGDGSVGTPQGGLTRELVWAGSGGDADLAGKSVRDKGVVIRSIPRPANFFSTGRSVPARLAALGAAFVVVIVDMPDPGQFLLPGQRAAKIPVLTLDGPDGDRLEAALGSATQPPLQARVELHVTEAVGLHTQNVIGHLQGATDETVVVTAHLDSYFAGANDNASGVAVMLALAEHLARSRKPLRKSYMFVATGGHHAAEFSPGTKDFAQRYRSVLDKSVLILNCEHLAPVSSQIWLGAAAMRGGVPDGRHYSNTQAPKFAGFSPANPVLHELLRKAIDRYGVTVERQAWTSTPGDAIPLQTAGYQIVQLIEVGYWYHSSLDTAEQVSSVGLERVARAYADFLHDVDATPAQKLRVPPS